jgi:hypothetical protein
LNKSGEGEHPYLVPNFKENAIGEGDQELEKRLDQEELT